MNDDPWRGIAAPTAFDSMTARRVDPEMAWDFFWGRSIDRKYLFALQHDADAAPTGKLPKLKGIELSLTSPPDDSKRILLFKLQDSAQRDIFERLCRDIVGAAKQFGSQKEAVAATIARTWRWHHLLRGGTTNLLTTEEQKGLIAELLVLERYVLATFLPDAALQMWVGPLDAPRDFECAKVCIEVKARRGAATPYVYISSAEQLDLSGIEALFLAVVELDAAPSGTAQAITLSEVAARIRTLLSPSPSASATMESLLEAAGFRWADDYSDFSWLEGSTRIFRVTDGFPRISASTLDAGISSVTYAISLQSCAPHEVGVQALLSALEATRDV